MVVAGEAASVAVSGAAGAAAAIGTTGGKINTRPNR